MNKKKVKGYHMDKFTSEMDNSLSKIKEPEICIKKRKIGIQYFNIPIG